MHAWCRNASEKGAEEEAERQLVSVKKLKGEVTRKEGMLKATQAELDKVLWATQPVWVSALTTSSTHLQANGGKHSC